MTDINKIASTIPNVTTKEFTTKDGLKKVVKTTHPNGNVEFDTFCTSTGEKLFHSSKTVKPNNSKLIKAFNYAKKKGITIAQLTLGENKAKMQASFKHDSKQKILPNGNFIHVVDNKLNKQGKVTLLFGMLSPNTQDLLPRVNIFNRIFGKI